MKETIEEIKKSVTGAIARGYCTDMNKNKILDGDLISAIAEEVKPLIDNAYKKGLKKGRDKDEFSDGYDFGFNDGKEVEKEKTMEYLNLRIATCQESLLEECNKDEESQTALNSKITIYEQIKKDIGE